jgi:hypothetical protein
VNATHALDVDEIQTTRGEKALAWVLGIFIAIGLVWTYVQLDLREPYAPPPPLSAQDQATLDAAAAAQRELDMAEAAQLAARDDLELRRERYRTQLDAGRPARALAAEYRLAEQRYADAVQRVAVASSTLAATESAAEEVNERRYEAIEAERRRDDRWTFGFRLAFALFVLGVAYAVLHALRGSRYFSLGIAGVGAAVLLSLVFAGDYVEDYVELRNNGPVVIALAGIVLTLGAFWSLQRYLQRRIPLARVRKGECPFCGFPARGNSSCEGCGRDVAGSCSHCGERRRVGVRFCGSCGQA